MGQLSPIAVYDQLDMLLRRTVDARSEPSALLRTASRATGWWHFAFLPRTSGQAGLILDALFDQDLSGLRVKVVRYDAGDISERACSPADADPILTR